MGKANFSDDFKRDAVAQITERGYPVSEVSQRYIYLSLYEYALYWGAVFGPVVRRRRNGGGRSLMRTDLRRISLINRENIGNF